MSTHPVVPPSAELSDLVKARMRDLGLRRTDVAKSMGWSNRTLDRITECSRGIQTPGELLMLARILQVQESAITDTSSGRSGDMPIADIAAVLQDIRDELRTIRIADTEEHIAVKGAIDKMAEVMGRLITMLARMEEARAAKAEAELPPRETPKPAQPARAKRPQRASSAR